MHNFPNFLSSNSIEIVIHVNHVIQLYSFPMAGYEREFWDAPMMWHFLQYNNPSIPNLLEVIFSVQTGLIPGQFQKTRFSTSQSLLKRRARQNQEMLSTKVWRCNFSSSCSLQHNFSTWIICKACQRKWQRDRGRHFWASPWPKAKPCGWFCSFPTSLSWTCMSSTISPYCNGLGAARRNAGFKWLFQVLIHIHENELHTNDSDIGRREWLYA